MTTPWIPVAVLALLLAPSLAAAKGPGPSAEDLLETPAATAASRIPAGYGTARIASALESGAYLSAIALSGEARGLAWSNQTWESMQVEAQPYPAYLDQLQDTLDAAVAAQAQAVPLLASAAAPPVAASEVDGLVLAGSLLHESDMALASTRTILQQARDTPQAHGHLQRYIPARFVHVALACIEAAQAILGDLPRPRGGDLDLDVIERHLSGYSLPSPAFASGGGLFQRLASYNEGAEGGFRSAGPDPMTKEVLAGAVADARATLAKERAAGLAGSHLAAHIEDAGWWLAQPAGLNAQADAGLLDELYGRVRAQEAAALLFARAAPEGTPWGTIALWVGGIAVAAVAAGLGALAWRRRDRRGEGPLLVLVLALAAALAAMPVPGARADQLPADPSAVPVAFTGASGVAGNGNFLLDGGKATFVWQETLAGTPTLRSRSQDLASGAWSTPVTLRQGSEQLSQPRLVRSAGQDTLLWVQGSSNPATSPLLVWACQVEAGACQDATALSPAGTRSTSPVLAADGAGHVFAAWSQADGPASRVYVRNLGPAGWGPAVLMPLDEEDEVEDAQAWPDIAVDAEGRAHVAWIQYATSRSSGGRAFHAILEPGASSVAAIGPVGPATITAILDVEVSASEAHFLLGSPQHGIANTRSDVHYVHGPLEGGSWSAPYNISRSAPRPVSWARLHLTPDGPVALWTESDSQAPQFFLRAARSVGTGWGRPTDLVKDPAYLTLVPFFSVDGAGTWHVVWSGSGPGTPDYQAHYRRFGQPFTYLPPSIRSIEPASGSWIEGQGVELTAFYEADASLSAQATRVTVAGQSVSVVVRPDRIVAQLGDFSEGSHVVALHIEDVQGGRVDSTVQLKVDQAAPSFQLGEIPSGWQRQQVPLQADPVQDTGSPVKIQIQLDDAGWLDVIGTVMLPEGHLYSLRFRAIDEAGNVALGSKVQHGWDASAPALEVKPDPAWSRDGALSLSFPANESSRGSPVTVRGQLEPQSGGAAKAFEAPLSAGRVEVRGLEPGAYRWTVALADAAGNQAAVDTTAWQVGVDVDPPEVVSDPQGGVAVLSFADGSSGLGRLVVLQRGEITQEEDGAGAATRQLRVDLSGTRTVRAEDRAGNVVELRLGSNGELQPQETVVVVGDDETDKPAKGLPGPPVALGITVLACLAAVLRRRAR